jgi:hypothetical protein
MMIVWGHNSFRLKKVAPFEVGLLDTSFNNMHFELRQRYGHLFWIPIFPIGQKWVVRKADNKMYEITPELSAHLIMAYPHKVSIWAFTGPLLVLAGMFLFSISEKLSPRRYATHLEESYETNAKQLGERVNQLRPNDYLLVSVKEPGKIHYTANKYPLKVLRVNGENIVLGNLAWSFSGAKSVDFDKDIARIEMDNAGVADTFTISKQQLKKAICANRSKENEFAGIAIKDFVTEGSCLLRDVMHIEGPQLSSVHLKGIENDGTYFEIVNMGFPGKADSVVSETPEVVWQLSKKRDLDFMDTIALRADGGVGDAFLYCTDAQKKRYKYHVERLGTVLRVTQLQ